MWLKCNFVSKSSTDLSVETREHDSNLVLLLKLLTIKSTEKMQHDQLPAVKYMIWMFGCPVLVV